MDVQTIKVEVEVCKESTEVVDAIVSVIKDIKAGKSVTEIAAGNLTIMMTAVNGFDQLDDEAKSDSFYETAGLGGARITKALLGK